MDTLTMGAMPNYTSQATTLAHTREAAQYNGAPTSPLSPYATISSISHSQGSWQPPPNPLPASPSSLGFATNNAPVPNQLGILSIGVGLSESRSTLQPPSEASSPTSPLKDSGVVRFHPPELGSGGRISIPTGGPLIQPPEPPSPTREVNTLPSPTKTEPPSGFTMHNAYRPVVKSLIAPKPGTVAPGMPTVTYLQSRALANDSAKRMAFSAAHCERACHNHAHTNHPTQHARIILFLTHALPLPLYTLLVHS